MADFLSTIDTLQTQFGSLQLNKIDINEISQYILIRELLQPDYQKQNLLPDIVRSEGYNGYVFPLIDFVDSAGSNEPESTSELINYFLSTKFDEALLNLNNKDISSLISYVEIFRCPRKDSQLDFDNMVKIPFATYYSKSALESILQSDQSTTAAGLSSVSIDVLSDTGAFYKYKIKLDIFFGNANVLQSNEIYNNLLRTPTVDIDKNPVSYLIKFGWARPSSQELINDIRLQALYGEKAFLILNLINYELSINPDGSVKLSVNFLGAAEQESDSVKTDVLENAFLKNNILKQYRDQIKSLEAEKKEGLDALKAEQQYALKRSAELYKKAEQLQQSTDEVDKEQLKRLKRMAKLEAEFADEDLTSAAPSENAYKDKDVVNTTHGAYLKIKNLKKIDEELSKYESLIEEEKYIGFFRQLYDFKRVYWGTVVFNAQKDGSSGMRFNVGDVLNDDGVRSVAIQGHLAQFEHMRDVIRRSQKIEEKKKTQTSQLEKDMIDAFTTAKTDGDFQSSIMGRITSLFDNQPSVDYGKIYFNYIFVGDVIASAYTNALSSYNYDNPKMTPESFFTVFLGTLDVVRDEVKNGKELLLTEKIPVDLAFFPIPINVFSSWFLKNVIDKRKKRYPFNEFVKDFMNDCVLTAISSYSTWESKFESQFTKSDTVKKSTTILKTFKDETIEMTYADLPYYLAKIAGTVASDDSPIPYLHNPLTPSDIKQAFVNKDISPFVSDNGKFVLNKCVFVYGKFGSVDKTGDYIDNLNSGIFHFFVGANTGILKDIKFNPISNQSLKDTQILNSYGDGKGKPLDSSFSVTQRYDVNITCIGFHYFKPGQIIYVDTSLLGFGKSTDVNSFSHIYNLGGYYLLTHVNHNIQGTDFSTSITGKFIGYGS